MLLAGLMAPGIARAHEVQPAVADVTLEGGRITMELAASLEPMIAGVNLDGLGNTNASPLSDEVDRLRALDPAALEAAFRDWWPEMQKQLTVTAGDSPVEMRLDGVEIPPAGNAELPRLSRLRLSGALPPGGAPVTIGWTPRLGALVLRQMGAGPEAYTGYLTGGARSDPIPRSGATAQGWAGAFLDYVPVGFDHIVPKGLDHILFVLGLFFLSMRMRPLLWQVTAFTVAHTVTLALASLGLVSVPSGVVEPLIAASIVYVGVENVLTRGLSPWRPAVVFGFGLLHGLGFASVLSDVGLGTGHFVARLIGFNVGVELGQLTVIAVAFLLVGYWFGRKPWYQRYVANPVSIAIALVGTFWLVERTLM